MLITTILNRKCWTLLAMHR